MAVHAQIPFALFAARVGTIEDAVMLLFQMRRTFQGHCATDVVIGRVNLRTAKAQMRKQIEAWIHELGGWNAQNTGAELCAQCPLIEHKADVEG